jgi:hypothetical protein
VKFLALEHDFIAILTKNLLKTNFSISKIDIFQKSLLFVRTEYLILKFRGRAVWKIFQNGGTVQDGDD